jgi:hypothetical protein
MSNTATMEAQIEAKEAIRAIETEEIRYDLFSLYSDVFKSYEGIRPRWAFDWSITQLQDGLDSLEAVHRPATVPTSGEGWAFVGESTQAELSAQWECRYDTYQAQDDDYLELWELSYHVPGVAL